MVTHELLVKAAGAVLTGLVGVSAYETVRKALGTAPHSPGVGDRDGVGPARNPARGANGRPIPSAAPPAWPRVRSTVRRQ